MENPFQGSSFNYGEFKAHIQKQMKALDIDQCEILDYGTEPKNKMRMTISKVCAETGMKVSTKTANDGNVWIKRIK